MQPEEPVPAPDPSPERGVIGLPTCVALTTATMVGTGVYTSLGFQLQSLSSGFSIMVLWFLGGVISLCGALSYAELAARLSRSGGEYTYLSEIYHPALGFMAACVSLIAGFAAPIALASLAFGNYLHAALPNCDVRASSLAAVILISLAHLRSLKTSALLQNGATLLKFSLVGIFLLLGAWAACSRPQTLTTLLPTTGSLHELTSGTSGIALLFVLYAYSGWNATTYVAGEVKGSRRTVGASLVLGTLLVTVLYVLLNAVFLTSAPASLMRGVLNVGSVSATCLLGPAGGKILSGIISLGLLASISAMVWAGPRVTQRVGEDYRTLRYFASKSEQGIPVRAILLQLLLVLGLVTAGSFETVLVFAQIPLLICLMLGVAGLFRMRQRQDKGDGFRCPLYPLPPVVFLLITVAGVVYSATCRPWVAMAGGCIMLIPLALHPWLARSTAASK